MMNSSTSRKRFPHVLNSVLNEGFGSVYWCEDHSAFAIKDEEQFAQLLPLYFKSKNMSAFKRNLSHYGFKKAPTRRGFSLHTASPFSTKDVSVYYHDTFQKDNMLALDSMRVVSSLKKKIAKPLLETPTAGCTEGGFTCPQGHINEVETMSSFSSRSPRHCDFGVTNNDVTRRSSIFVMASDAPKRRGSLVRSQRRNSLEGPAFRTSLEILDRISKISLCGLDSRGSHMSSLSDIRWSNLGSPLSNQEAQTHRETSIHSLAGIDLSEEAFLRDLELDCNHRDTEENILGFYTEPLSRVSSGEDQNRSCYVGP